MRYAIDAPTEQSACKRLARKNPNSKFIIIARYKLKPGKTRFWFESVVEEFLTKDGVDE